VEHPFASIVESMVERDVRTMEEHLRKVISRHQRNLERLPLFLLAYRASIHGSTGSTPGGTVFGREVGRPCCLLCGAPTID
jgi:hypothetical protein